MMDLNDLTATELARLDAICLDYEKALRNGNAPSIESVIEAQAGKHAEILRNELIAIRDEISKSDSTDPARSTFAFTTHALPLAGGTSESIGHKIGPYLISRILGQGGMGIVYEAIDTRLDRKVAIKMLAAGNSIRDQEKRASLCERFEREARAVAALSHPNIVELFDVGVNDANPFAVMELLEGETLDQYLAKTPCNAATVRHIGAQIADALAVAHRAGVVHRDLKPQNIMVMQSGSAESKRPERTSSKNGAIARPIAVKLFDFGLSRSERGLFDGDPGGRTSEGVVMGTPGYMAPEQARGETAGPAADIFALGCLLFEAFYHKRAFDGATASARFASTLESTPETDPLRRRTDVELADLINECLNKEVSKRPASADDIALRLRRRGAAVDPIEQQLEHGYGAGVFVRRRFFELVTGGALGGILGGLAVQYRTESLRDIDSLAVLSFTSMQGEPTRLASLAAGQPLGDQTIEGGDEIAMLLVNELSRLKDVNVTPFRPFVAHNRDEIQAIGRELEVDALVTGNLKTILRGEKLLEEINLQIVSTRTGNQLWGASFVSEPGASLLEKSQLASDLAAAVGRSLTTSGGNESPLNQGSFSCLVDGVGRADPDSPEGLRKALSCFRSAHRQDKSWAAPLGGIALTSITLAAQSPTEESIALIQAARESAEEALKLDPNLASARLADAMLLWQTLYRYDEAARILNQLLLVEQNFWQVYRQLGLLELTRGNQAEALRLLREATQLNPLSVIAKVGLARAHWSFGNIERAIADAKRLRNSHPDNRLARGLLIDLYEHSGDFDAAAAEHVGVDFGTKLTAETYYGIRQTVDLAEYPYGPFGTLLNQAILDSRISGGIDDVELGTLADSTPPMLPLLLAGHPSFASARRLPRAAEILPLTYSPFSSANE
ncbi:protein kinase domain-containing protein [Novipirellula caenicola]|uniref:Serine/threonine-protein kinase PknD n=1 Tax=Novipirellula caenicola TaxID=1536901 RepID=A0ABP9VZ61_9BACT